MGFFCILALMNLSFGQPIFLWGLLTIGVPIWIHFFNKKNRSTLFFSDIRVLQGTPTKGKGLRVIKDLLLLFFRILAISALILAFSEPRMTGFLNEDSQNTFLYVDNHLGLLERNRQSFNAKKVKLPRSQSPLFLVLNSAQNADFDSKTWNEVIDSWDKLPISDRVVNSKAILDRIGLINAEQSAGPRLKIIWVSDFPRMGKLPEFPKNSDVLLVPIDAPSMANVVVDSIWNNTSQIQKGQAFNLKVRIKNVGNDQARNQKMSLYLDDFSVSTEKINLLVGEVKWLEFGISISEKDVLKAKLISDDKVLFDNIYSFVLEIPESKDVYALEGVLSEKYMSKVFLNDSLFDFHTLNHQTLMLNLFKIKGFLILDDLAEWSNESLKSISNWVKMGNTLLIIPRPNLNLGMVSKLNSNFSSQGNLFKQEISTSLLAVRLPNKNQRFFNSILEQSSFKKNLEMFRSSSYLQWNGGLPLFEYVNGKPFLSQFKLGSGYTYVFSGGIAKESDGFILHGLFLPVLHEMALSNAINFLSNSVFSDGFQITAPKAFKSNYSEKDLVTLVKGKQSWIPEQKWAGNKWICQWPEIVDRNFSGFWQANIRDKKSSYFGVNYPLRESEFNAYSRQEIQNHYKGKKNIKVDDLNGDTGKAGSTKNLSFYFFVASLCFFLLEMTVILLNRLKIIP